MTIKKTSTILAVLLALCLAPSVAYSHAIFLFAWEQGSQICTSSYYNKQNKVAGGTVLALGSNGTVLAEGTTDENGEWCFDRPEQTDTLTIILDAGQGHRKTYDISLEERPNLSPPSPAGTEPYGYAYTDRPDPEEAHSSLPASEERLRLIVREEIHRALTLQDSHAEPGLKDILGGIGWLVGLCGLAAFFMAKRRHKG